MPSSEDPELSQNFHVPDIVPELTAERVLATEWAEGVPIDRVASMPQEVCWQAWLSSI